MTDRLLARARAGDERAFRGLTDPYRRELQLHVYRIVGSAQDAEDLVQETLLAAWRGLEQFQERASVRSWLYRIATNRSLDALRARRRRLEDQRMTQMPEPTRFNEPVWLSPYPDVLLEGVPDEAPGPDTPHGSYRKSSAWSHAHSANERARRPVNSCTVGVTTSGSATNDAQVSKAVSGMPDSSSWMSAGGISSQRRCRPSASPIA